MPDLDDDSESSERSQGSESSKGGEDSKDSKGGEDSEATRIWPMSQELLPEAAAGRDLEQLTAKTVPVLIPAQLLQDAGLSDEVAAGGMDVASRLFDEPTDATGLARVPADALEALIDGGFLHSAVAGVGASVPREAVSAPVAPIDDDDPTATVSLRFPIAAAPQSAPRQATPRVTELFHVAALPKLVDGDGGLDIDLGNDEDGIAAQSNADAQSVPPVISDGLDATDFFAVRSSSFRLDELLANGESDAVVIGDPTNVVEHIRHEVIAPGRPPWLRDVMLGGDVAQLSLPQAIVKPTGRDDSGLALSAFERFALREIDGRRSNAAIRENMRISADDLRLVLSLLADKELITLVAVPDPESVAPAPAAPPAAVAAAAEGAVGDAGGGAVGLPSPAASPAAPEATTASAPAGLMDPVTDPPAPGESFLRPPASPGMHFSYEKTDEQSELSTRSERSLHTQDTDFPWTQEPTPARAGISAFGKAVSTGGFVVENAQSQANTRFEEAVRLIKSGKATTARRHIEVAQTLAPDDPRFSDALMNWRAFVALHETAPDQRAFARAIRAEALGDIQGAVELLRQATSMNPNHANAWNRLGLLLARTHDLPAAIDALSRAVELAPNDPSILANFSRVAEAHEHSVGLDGKLRALWRRFVG